MSHPIAMALDAFMILVGASCIYIFVLRRLAGLVQPYRMELADLGESLLLKDPPPDRAEQIRFYLDHAFSGWPMLVAMILFPFFAVWLIAQCATAKGREKIKRADKSPDRVATLFNISTFAANPLCGMLFMVELLIFGMLLFLVAGFPAIFYVLTSMSRVEALKGRGLQSA